MGGEGARILRLCIVGTLPLYAKIPSHPTRPKTPKLQHDDAKENERLRSLMCWYINYNLSCFLPRLVAAAVSG